MIRFKNDTPTIMQIFQYTYLYVYSRFEYSKRDLLPTKLTVNRKKAYALNKEGKFSAPRERLEIRSWSAPQYPPYSKIKSKGAKRQMKVKHNYNIIFAIQLDSNENYSFQSKIIWRVGSYQKPNFHPPQKYIKTIYTETREKLKKRIERKEKDPEKRKQMLEKELTKIKNSATYLDVGDYNSQVKGVNLDNYFRCYPLQAKFNCLYGPPLNLAMPEKIVMPFFCKHSLGVIAFLLKKGILKIS